MPCPHNEFLLAFAAGDLEPAARERLEAHLAAGCPACERELAAVAHLRRLAAPDALELPPAGVLARAQRIPDAARQSPVAVLAGRLAALVFDTVRDPLPQGARTAAARSRQLLYRALDYDIDVRVTAAGAGRVRVTGQVLPGPDREIDAVSGVEVAIFGPLSLARTTNELGEFDFGQLEEGDYTLSVEADEERLLVEPLPVRPA